MHREAEPFHSMNLTDDLEQNAFHRYTPGFVYQQRFTLNEGTYRVTNRDGTTGTIVVKPGSSLTIWTQSTIERV